MLKQAVCVLGLCSAIAGTAQNFDSTAVKYAETITSYELRDHLMVLASDEFEGRETGYAGQKKAADYIRSYFKELGVPGCIEGDYVQSFPLRRESVLESSMKIGDKALTFVDDFYFFPGFEGDQFAADEVVVAGYGIQSEGYNDYADLNVKDKIVLVLPGEPMDKNGKSRITGTESMSEWSGDFRVKRELAQKLGAKALLVVNVDYDRYMGRVKYYLQNPGMRLDMERPEKEDVLPVFFIKMEDADYILSNSKLKSVEKASSKINKKGKSYTASIPLSIEINANRKSEKLTSENVLCYIEGSDPELKDEVLVITAHYDHVGKDGDDIYNGADDDGSGTVSVMEIAEAFMMAKNDGFGPKRSVLIMTVSGEEKGLLGSEWYTEHPVFPLENTIADLNVDMIGRVDEAHKDNENYVYLIGSDKLSTQLHSISEKANELYTNLELDYTYNAPDDPNRFYYRSDHYNFAKNNIPVIFYFSGVHEDYHQPTDTPDKIMYDKTASIAKLIFYTAWELANRTERIVVDVKNDFD